MASSGNFFLVDVRWRDRARKRHAPSWSCGQLKGSTKGTGGAGHPTINASDTEITPAGEACLQRSLQKDMRSQYACKCLLRSVESLSDFFRVRRVENHLKTKTSRRSTLKAGQTKRVPVCTSTPLFGARRLFQLCFRGNAMPNRSWSPDLQASFQKPFSPCARNLADFEPTPVSRIARRYRFAGAPSASRGR